MTSVRRVDCGICVLRRWRPEDKASLILHANNRRVWRNLRDLFPHPYTKADADHWLRFATVEDQAPWTFAVEVSGQAIGGISLVRHGDVEIHTAELGYWLGEAFWGRGIATAAVRAITAAAFEHTDIYRVYADVFAWNPGSMRVLEKAGYHREAVLLRAAFKDGTLVDRVVYALTRDPGLPYVAAQFANDSGPASSADPRQLVDG
jgi:ribosomal-protein-alanine N-acetyltransferase